MKLNWLEVVVHNPEGDFLFWKAETPVAVFTLNLEPEKLIRGPWRLVIWRVNELVSEQTRFYHDLENAKEEATLMNDAIMKAEA